MSATQKRASAFRFIIAIGVVSLFADMTYEGARSVVGPFLKDLGASAKQVGIIMRLWEVRSQCHQRKWVGPRRPHDPSAHADGTDNAARKARESQAGCLRSRFQRALVVFLSAG